MNKIQASSLSLFVAVLSFLAVIALLFFAATASKNPMVFLVIAVFFALSGAFWVGSTSLRKEEGLSESRLIWPICPATSICIEPAGA